MIENAKQYEVTKQQIERLEKARSAVPTNLHPLQYQAEKDACTSLIDELQAELKEYEVRQKA
jgi:flagellar biogenesis protein FliO